MDSTFRMVSWGKDKSTQRGNFSFDVVFKNNKKGFVVQYLRKIIRHKTPGSSVAENNYSYWEIFYIDGSGKSRNTDRFAQNSLKRDSEGSVIQIGYAYFFPYDEPVTQKNQVIELTEVISEIFGAGVEPDVIPYANGLPSSEHQPAMNNLTVDPKVIIRKLTVTWGPHETFSNKTDKGWETIVVPEVFEDDTWYQKFPWKYPGQRPLDPEAPPARPTGAP